jgi:uncharacterized protein YggU (UPF0235/DUF167 family)
VQPRAAQDELIDAQPRPRLRGSRTAVDDRANLAAIEWLAEAFGVAKAQVEIVRGQRGRDKLFRIHAPRACRSGSASSPRLQALAAEHATFCSPADWL